jgi:hypothetical protein
MKAGDFLKDNKPTKPRFPRIHIFSLIKRRAGKPAASI